MTAVPAQAETIYPSVHRPWKQYFPEEIFQETLPEKSMYDFMHDLNKDYPNDIALEYLDIRVTYGELFQRIDETARALIGLGVQPGDIVTIAMPNTPEFVYLAYAVNRVGAVMNNVHPLPGAEEMAGYLNEAESRIIFMFDGTWNAIHSCLEKTKVEKAVVVSPAQSLGFVKRKLYRMANPVHLDRSVAMDWGEFLKAGKGVDPVFPEKDPSLPAVISHTGGTTGEPKGVLLPDNAENAYVFQIMKAIDLCKERQLCMLVVLPPFVNYSFTAGIHEGLCVGCKVALIADYKSDHFGEYYEKYHVNVVNTIPSYCMDMMNDEKCQNMDLSGLKLVIVAGEAMDQHMEEEINTFLHDHGAKIRLTKGYGCTEFACGVTFTFDEVNFPGTVGIPHFLDSIKIVEPETTIERPINKKGEVCITGPCLMIGYLNNQEETDAIIRVHEDGKRWLHMGDIGYIDEHGALFITGRIKRILATVGPDGNPTKLFPDRIERAIQLCDAVEVCCVVGVRDEKRLFLPKAYVELLDKGADRETVTEQILEKCREKLPDYMVPVEIEYMDALPRTERGKVDYRALESTDITNE